MPKIDAEVGNHAQFKGNPRNKLKLKGNIQYTVNLIYYYL